MAKAVKIHLIAHIRVVLCQRGKGSVTSVHAMPKSH